MREQPYTRLQDLMEHMPEPQPAAPQPAPVESKRALKLPLHIVGDSICDSDGFMLAHLEITGAECGFDERVIACVNACAGMTDAELATLRHSPVDAGAIDADDLEQQIAADLEAALCDGKISPDAYVSENRKTLRQLIDRAIARSAPVATAGVSDGERMRRPFFDMRQKMLTLRMQCFLAAQQLSRTDWAFVFYAPNNGGDYNTRRMEELIETLVNYSKTSDEPETQAAMAFLPPPTAMTAAPVAGERKGQ